MIDCLHPEPCLAAVSADVYLVDASWHLDGAHRQRPHAAQDAGLQRHADHHRQLRLDTRVGRAPEVAADQPPHRRDARRPADEHDGVHLAGRHLAGRQRPPDRLQHLVKQVAVQPLERPPVGCVPELRIRAERPQRQPQRRRRVGSQPQL